LESSLPLFRQLHLRSRLPVKITDVTEWKNHIAMVNSTGMTRVVLKGKNAEATMMEDSAGENVIVCTECIATNAGTFIIPGITVIIISNNIQKDYCV